MTTAFANGDPAPDDDGRPSTVPVNPPLAVSVTLPFEGGVVLGPVSIVTSWPPGVNPLAATAICQVPRSMKYGPTEPVKK